MGNLSRRKGKEGERAWRDELREAGFNAKRGQQFAGGPDSPDVICDDLKRAHFEVKVGKRIRVEEAMAQASEDCGADKVPIVASRKDRGEWLVTMRAQEWFAILRDGIAALKAAIEAPMSPIGELPVKRYGAEQVPGQYLCHCIFCPGQFIGAKRDVVCPKCADGKNISEAQAPSGI